MPGALLHSSAEVVRQLLIDLGVGNTPSVGGDQPAWPVFADNEPGTPNNIVNVTDTLGISFRRDAHGFRNEHHGVQIKVRGGTHALGYPKARAIAVALDGVTDHVAVTVGASEYCVGLVKRTGDVLRLGPEQGNSRRGYTINALVYVRLN